MDGDAVPSKIFDRHASLSNTQIINYKVNNDGKWMSLVGISSKDNRIVGSMQLFSREKNVSQPLEGHASCFAELKLEGGVSPTRLFSFAVRSATGAKVRTHS